MARLRSALVVLCIITLGPASALAQSRGLLDRLKKEAAEEIGDALRQRDAPAETSQAAAPATAATPANVRAPDAVATPAATSTAGSAPASSWTSRGPWGATIGATPNAQGSIALTFATGRAVLARSADGAFEGTWYGPGNPCAAPRDGERAWGSVRLLAPTPTMVNLVLTECSDPNQGQPIAQFMGMLASGTSPFTTLADFQRGARTPAATSTPVAAAAPPAAARTAPTASAASAALPPELLARMPSAAIAALPPAMTAAGAAQPPPSVAAAAAAATNGRAAAPPADTGKLLVDTDLVSAYAFNTRPSQPCVAGAMLVFKVDERYEIVADERYSAMLREVLPAITAHCPSADGYSFFNYVDGHTAENPLGAFFVRIVDGVGKVDPPQGWRPFSVRAQRIAARL